MTTLILLAAGRGSRMKGLTQDIPKCLNHYHGKSLIQHILDISTKFKEEITRTVIISGYKSELLAALEYEILENKDWSITGPFRSLLLAEKYLKTTPCIVSYTDIVYGEEFLKSCLVSKASIFLPSNANFEQSWSGRQVDILKDLESFISADNKLIEIGNRPKALNEVQGQFAGIFKTLPDGWKSLAEVQKSVDSQNLDMTGLFSLALKKGISIECKQIKSNWKEFDLPSDFDE